MMNVVIRLSSRAELKALPILLRHSPGTMLPGRTYIIRAAAASALKRAGVPFTIICQRLTGPEASTGGPTERERRL
jgi:hypothetical protein